MLNTWEVNQVELSERKKLVLSNIVEQYIATGAPVGSKAVCSALDSACSSATVRNEMSELIELGFLVQPHLGGPYSFQQGLSFLCKQPYEEI